MKRLGAATLDEARARLPAYDRAAVRAGVLHIGVGSFHRAHQAAAIDDCLSADPGWGICGVSLRRDAVRAALAPQDGLYTLAVADADGLHPRIIGALTELHHCPQVADLAALLCRPEIRLVTLTVTEKAYCRDAAGGGLDPDHPDIRADIANPQSPRSLPGMLLATLAARHRVGLPAPTLLSCDNLPDNGGTLRRVLAEFAALRGEHTAMRLVDDLACPSCMVDRITPATTDADRARIAALTGVQDAWPVVTEPFSQWVIEDRFALGRPPLELGGAQFVSDVAPHETMKLRMLNGAHSALACLGLLAGFRTVAEAMAHPPLAGFVKGLMLYEAAATLDVPGTDLAAHAAALARRFANPALNHRLDQIATDSSQKLPQRLLSTLRDLRAARAPHPRTTLAVAAWLRFMAGNGEDGAPLTINDPIASAAAEAARCLPDVAAYVARMLDLRSVFGDLADAGDVRADLTERLQALFAQGVREVLASSVR